MLIDLLREVQPVVALYAGIILMGPSLKASMLMTLLNAPQGPYYGVAYYCLNFLWDIGKKELTQLYIAHIVILFAFIFKIYLFQILMLCYICILHMYPWVLCFSIPDNTFLKQDLIFLYIIGKSK